MASLNELKWIIYYGILRFVEILKRSSLIGAPSTNKQVSKPTSSSKFQLEVRKSIIYSSHLAPLRQAHSFDSTFINVSIWSDSTYATSHTFGVTATYSVHGVVEQLIFIIFLIHLVVPGGGGRHLDKLRVQCESLTLHNHACSTIKAISITRQLWCSKCSISSSKHVKFWNLGHGSFTDVMWRDFIVSPLPSCIGMTKECYQTDKLCRFMPAGGR